MDIKEKKKKVFETIEKLAESQGWHTELSESRFADIYRANLRVTLIKNPVDNIESPMIELEVDFKNEVYIEHLKLNLYFAKGYLEFTTLAHIDIDNLPKLLERVDILSMLPETIGEYLTNKGKIE